MSGWCNSNFLNRRIDLLKRNIEGTDYEVIKEISSKLNMVKEIFIDLNFDSADLGARLRTTLGLLEHNRFKYNLAGTTQPPFFIER